MTSKAVSLGLVVLALLSLAAAPCAAKPEPQFTFAVIGDRTEDADESVFEQVLSEVSQLNPAFMVSVGDLIEGYTADSVLVEGEWNEIFDLLDATGVQYYVTPGNHDIFDRPSESIFRKRLGGPDRYFKFMNSVFVILDVSRLSRADAIPKEEMDWLRRVLEASRNAKGIYIFYHKPFWCEDFSAGRDNVLHQMFLNYPVRAVFTGHYHRYFHTVRDGIQYFGVSSSGGSLPPGGRDQGSFYCYMLARVRGDSVTVNLLEPGIFKPVDVVTLDQALKMARVEDKSVGLSELLAYDYRMSSLGQTTITIENLSRATLTDTARWVLRGDWAVQPMRDYVEVPPEEVGKLTAFVRCDGYLFPVPILEMRLPCCDGKVVEITKPLNVKRVTYADYADSAPAIDGSSNDPVWQGLAGESDFFGPQGGKSPADSTVLRICYDSTNVYLLAECLDRNIDKISSAVTERDAFAANDDAVTFLFEPLRDSDTFFQIAVNPRGTIFDRRIQICPFGTYVADPTWDAPAVVATRVLADRWLVEMAIPLAALKGDATGESRWGFNFMRFQPRLGATADFQAPFRYRSDEIGVMGFR